MPSLQQTRNHILVHRDWFCAVVEIMSKKKKVLMVCFGNTCRSPIAEAVFRKFIEKHRIKDKWEVDSAALFGYHEGKGINAKSLEVLEKNGITDYYHTARTIKKEDFENFDWIFGMDYYNIGHLGRIQPQGTKAKIELLGLYDPEGEIIIEDPYFDDDISRFEKAYEQCSRCISVFIQRQDT